MAADFIPVGGVASILVVQRDLAEKVAKDFFREEWVAEPTLTTLMEDLEGALGLMETEVVGEEVEVTLGEEVESPSTTPVGVGEGRTMLANTNRTIVVTIPLGMERSLSHFCRVYNKLRSR